MTRLCFARYVRAKNTVNSTALKAQSQKQEEQNSTVTAKIFSTLCLNLSITNTTIKQSNSVNSFQIPDVKILNHDDNEQYKKQ